MFKPTHVRNCTLYSFSVVYSTHFKNRSTSHVSKKMVKNFLNWATIYNLTLLAKLQISFARSVDFESIRYIQLRVGRRSDYCAGETQ